MSSLHSQKVNKGVYEGQLVTSNQLKYGGVNLPTKYYLN